MPRPVFFAGLARRAASDWGAGDWARAGNGPDGRHLVQRGRLPLLRLRYIRGTCDLDDRALWSKFQEAYQQAISETSTKDAPWYIVPADSNSTRNMAVGEILRTTLERLDPKIPEPEAGLDGVKVV